MVFQVLLHHFVRYHTSAPDSISNGPEMPPPILFPQTGVLLLQNIRCPTLQLFDQFTHAKRRRVFHVHVNMVRTHHALQYVHILAIADLHQQVPTPSFYVAGQHLVPIFRHPHYVARQVAHAMRRLPIFGHVLKLAKHF